MQNYAMRSEDLRCKGLIPGVVVEMYPRYKDLCCGGSIEMEDSRCRIAVTEMEDPRCMGLNRAW